LKKILSSIVIIIFAGVVTCGFLVWQRYEANPEQIVPYPYFYNFSSQPIKPEAPILIIGDRMGDYFSKFSVNLAETISVNLAKPIKIQSIARKGQGLHRTLHELKSLTQWPQILIYQGGSEEFIENKFHLTEMTKIKSNFQLYKDDRVETILILYPWLSRIIYEPVNRVSISETPIFDEYNETNYLKKLETELLLFEQQLVEMVNLSKDRNSLIILTTTPINLDEPPRKVCHFTSTSEVEIEINELREMLKANNPKEAYKRSGELLQKFTGNADLLYIHGQISKRLGLLDEAVDTLLNATAFECKPWRTSHVQNSIIRKVARNHQVILFDYARMVENDFLTGTTYFDEIHPQNLYYEKAMEQLGLVIKGVLKL
jgi:hypothetical protein